MDTFMSINERSLLEKYLRKAVNYFEFGSGGSTILADKYQNIISIKSIESDVNFIHKVKPFCSSKVDLIHANIGEVELWGVPLRRSNLFLNYTTHDTTGFDTVFIDGRFRVASCLSVCSHNKECTIIIHDFTNREEYQVLRKFLDIIEECETMIIAKVKKSVDLETIMKVYNEYQFDWR